MAIEWPIKDPVLQFTVLLAAVLVFQFIMKRLHLPSLIGLLIMGMVLGPGGFHLLPREPVVDLMGSIGLIYVMFIAGLEIDTEIVRSHKRETLSLGLCSFAFPLILAAGAALILGWDWPAALLLGALISSHTLLSYPMVQRLGLLQRRSVVAATGGTLLTDTLALVLLVFVIQLRPGGSAEPLEAFGPLALLVFIVLISLILVPRASRWMLRTRLTQAEKALYVLVVLMVLASAMELIGTEKILGAFLAGVCLNQVLSQQEVLREHVEFVGKMLFIPFFFVSTGMLLELSVFTEQWQMWTLAGLLLGMVILGKTSAAWIVGKWFGYGPRDRVLIAGMTLPQAAATLAVTISAHNAGIFDDIVIDAVVVLIFITCLVGPLLTQWAGTGLSKKKQQAETKSEQQSTGQW